MKTRNLILSLGIAAAALTSCKNEKEAKAEKTVNGYVIYVDSLNTIPEADAKTNWKAIDAAYQMRISQAEAALADVKDKSSAQQKLDVTKAKYEAMKTKMEAEMAPPPPPVAAAPNPRQQLRNALFGEGKIGDDMNFGWVNKDNIHSVYQQLVHTVENNKEKYSREDWDEIKIMYEALDSRKNTVEKEGLSSEDNMKIAGLKIKFAPMLKIKRMEAKGTEMAKAKK